MVRVTLLVLVLLSLLGCHSSPKKLVIDDGPTLPTAVAGASDPFIIKMQNKLAKQGVRVITMGQMYLVSIPTPLLFADQSPELKWSSYNLLNEIVCYLQQFRKITVHINAYSSCYLSEQRTHALTLARSRIIANYLWSQTIETRMVFTQGMGNNKPIVAFSKCTDSSPNSRIEIIFRRAVA
ncbi:MAG: OmpA family protein [Legionellaceae bacterium]|nr:OmpA family protein [Legionellaceae bacterium]